MKHSLFPLLAMMATASHAQIGLPNFGDLHQSSTPAQTLDLRVTARVLPDEAGGLRITLGLRGRANELAKVAAVTYEVRSGQAAPEQWTVSAAGQGNTVRFRSEFAPHRLPDEVQAQITLVGSSQPTKAQPLSFAPDTPRVHTQFKPRYHKVIDRHELQDLALTWSLAGSARSRLEKVSYAIRHDQTYGEVKPAQWAPLSPRSTSTTLYSLWARSGATWYGVKEESYQVWIQFQFADGRTEHQAIWIPGALPGDLDDEALAKATAALPASISLLTRPPRRGLTQ